MKALIQRVSEAGVDIGGSPHCGIGHGMVVLLCAERGDTGADMEYLVRKTANLRIFEDGQGKMNLSLLDSGGEALVVSQFTLAADTRRGNRPSFVQAEEPVAAEARYLEFVDRLRALGIKTSTGVFGAMMQVRLLNDGPVTVMLESKGR